MNLWIALLFLLGLNNGNGYGNGCGCSDNNGCGSCNDCMRPWGVPDGNSRANVRMANDSVNDGGCACAACNGDGNVSDGSSCGRAGQNGSREFPSF